MLEVIPQEKMTKEIKASLSLLISAFVSVAEEVLREEAELEEREVKAIDPAIPKATSSLTIQRGGNLV